MNVNSRMKRRFVVVTGLIVVVLATVMAVVGGNSAAKTISVKEAAAGDFSGKRVQVTGNVVKNSYTMQGDVLAFSIYDPDDRASSIQLPVAYTGSASSTFGNDVTAICTGKMAEDGTLQCSELVTKCPSKYESGSDALQVSRMLEYGDDVLDKTIRVTGSVKTGSQAAAGAGDRFVLCDLNDPAIEVPVVFDDAVSDQTLADDAVVVLTGHMGADGRFDATNVALEG